MQRQLQKRDKSLQVPNRHIFCVGKNVGLYLFPIRCKLALQPGLMFSVVSTACDFLFAKKIGGNKNG